MRSKEFVSRTGQKIAAELIDIEECVGSEMHSIAEHECADLVRGVGDFAHRIDRAGRVRSASNCNQLRSLVDEVTENIEIERAVLVLERSKANGRACVSRRQN